MKTLKLVTFDVTGTILGFRQSVGQQYSKTASFYGINVSPNAIEDQFKPVFKNLMLEHPNFGKNSVGWKSWWKELLSRVLTQAIPDKVLKSDVVDKISVHLINSYKTNECWELVDGSLDLLQKLRNKNKCLGVISNYDPRLNDILQNLKVDTYFDFVLTSYNAKCVKPNPGIFKAVEEMYTNVEKNEILHIGDNPELDFVGARQVGWNAILVTQNPGKTIEKYPQIEEKWIVESLDQIYNILDHKKLL